MKVCLEKAGLDVVSIRPIINKSDSLNVKRWAGKLSNGNGIYIKTVFNTKTTVFYDCEVECLASELALVLGVRNVVIYGLDKMIVGNKLYKVCICNNIDSTNEFKTFGELIPNLTIDGVDMTFAYNHIASSFPRFRADLDAILVFDSIIGNHQRLLTQLGIVTNSAISGIPLFDSNLGLFHNGTLDDIKTGIRDNIANQSIGVCGDFRYRNLVNMGDIRLNKISTSYLRNLVNKYFSGERADLIYRYLLGRLKIYGLVVKA